MLKIIQTRLDVYVEMLGFRKNRSTEDMLNVIRMLQEFGRDHQIPLYFCFIDLTKAYDSIDRETLWIVLARAGVPPKMINIIRSFHDDMRAAVRIDGKLSEWLLDSGKAVSLRHCSSTFTSQQCCRYCS